MPDFFFPTKDWRFRPNFSLASPSCPFADPIPSVDRASKNIPIYRAGSTSDHPVKSYWLYKKKHKSYKCKVWFLGWSYKCKVSFFFDKKKLWTRQHGFSNFSPCGGVVCWSELKFRISKSELHLLAEFEVTRPPASCWKLSISVLRTPINAKFWFWNAINVRFWSWLRKILSFGTRKKAINARF